MASLHVIHRETGPTKLVVRFAESSKFTHFRYSSGLEFLDQCDLAEAGCVVGSCILADMELAELTRILRREASPLSVVSVDCENVAQAIELMRSGATHAFDSNPEDTEFQRVVEEAITQSQGCARVMKLRAVLESRLQTLRPVELKVLGFVISGHANKQISTALDLGLRTVEAHRQHIMKKMEANSIAELVVLCVNAEQLGLDVGFKQSGAVQAESGVIAISSPMAAGKQTWTASDSGLLQHARRFDGRAKGAGCLKSLGSPHGRMAVG